MDGFDMWIHDNVTPDKPSYLVILAQRAYKGYGSVTDFKNYQGLHMPEWDALTPRIQLAWMRAVEVVLDDEQEVKRECQR